MAVIHQHRRAGLCQAVHLGVDWLFEAVGVGLERERGGELGGVVLDRFRVVFGDRPHGGEVALDALLLEGGLIQVDISPDKGAGAAFYGGAQGLEVAAGLGRNEQESLLRIVGYGHRGALGGVLMIPGVDLGKPRVGRLVGGAAEKGDDEEQMILLVVGQIGLDPELIAGLQVRHLRDGQGPVATRDAHHDLGSGKVKAGVVGVEGCGKGSGEQAGDVRKLHR